MILYEKWNKNSIQMSIIPIINQKLLDETIIHI